MSEWISVSEALPSDEGSLQVLLYAEEDGLACVVFRDCAKDLIRSFPEYTKWRDLYLPAKKKSRGK